MAAPVPAAAARVLEPGPPPEPPGLLVKSLGAFSAGRGLAVAGKAVAGVPVAGVAVCVCTAAGPPRAAAAAITAPTAVVGGPACSK